jgi:hypothetical protein
MKRLNIFLLICTVFFLVGCSNKMEDKLIGNWKQIPFYNPDSVAFTYSWQFYAGDRLEITKNYKDGTTELDSAFTYSVKNKTLNIFGSWGYAPAAGDFRGAYWIDELDKKYLKITKREHPNDTAVYKPDTVKVSPYLRIEFAKQ